MIFHSTVQLTKNVFNLQQIVHLLYLDVTPNKSHVRILHVLLITQNVLFQMDVASNSHTKELMENATLLLSLDMEK